MLGGPRGMDVHPECVAAAEQTARALEAEGHTVEHAYPEALDDPAGISAYVTIVAASVGFALDAFAEKVGRAITEDDVEPLTWALGEIGRSHPATRYIAALDAVNTFSRRVASWWESGFDLLLTPTTAAPPPRLGEMRSTREEPLAGFARAAPYGAYTMNFNLTGQPGISLPVHWTGNGLPVGAHLVAPYGREDMLIELATEVEGLLPWAERRPPVSVSQS